MQRTRKSRTSFRLAMIAACIGLAMSSLASAQVVVTSPETDTVKGRAPQLATATITGTPSGSGGTVYVVGDVLTATYTVTDPDGDTPDLAASDATIEWLRDNVVVGNGKTYTLTAGDSGKSISYRVKPMTDPSITDPFEGEMTVADHVGSDGAGNGDGIGGGGEIVPAPNDLLLSVAVSGSAIVDGELTATPTCQSTCTGNITYQWQLETGNGSGVYADIAGQTGSTYTPAKGDQKRKVKVVANQPAF